MNTTSVAPEAFPVKQHTKKHRVKCRVCDALGNVGRPKSHSAATTRAMAHVETHPGHFVEVQTIETEVIYGKDSKL